MKFFATVLLALLITSCATNKHIEAMGKNRQYSKEEKDKIAEHAKKYISMLSHGAAFSSAFDMSNSTNAQKNVQLVYCNCAKKLNDACFAKSSPKFDKQKKRIWIKGNAAEMALHATGNHALADRDMCN